MKAVVWHSYGPPDVLKLEEVEKPVPKDNEVLVKILATTVTAGDCEMRSLNFPLFLKLPMRIWLGIFKPRGTAILGTEISGEIESVGKDVTLLSKGDQVFGAVGMSFGTNTEYKCLPEKPHEMKGGVVIKPANMTHGEAAAVPFGGRDALHFLRKGNIQKGQKILIIGAGGSIGTFAVQLSKYFGAGVTAVDSADKLDMLSSIGSDYVVDYMTEDYTQSGESYDIVFDVVGKSSFSGCLGLLKEKGVYLLANPRLPHITRGIWTNLRSSNKVIFEAASSNGEDLVFLRELIEDGKIISVIDRTYPLEQIVEAHQYIETGRKSGNVVITVSASGRPNT
ncbi:MAG: NAD(P)-dependent alcohol dehydrogenase [Spirochaetales bacterium]|jgi:NADPH:quinone reductase-like Zn-dependent oxidoreductase|nr:NAD(P)-dependent alcohol dehydrogenase [Spirochaetales bacterium]